MDKNTNFINSLKQDCKQILYIVGIFSFFINLLMLTLPIYMLQVFDRVLASFSGETLLYLTLIATFLLGVFGALNAVRVHILAHLSSWLDSSVSPNALGRSMDEILRGNRYASRALTDIATIQQFINGSAIATLFDVPWVPVFLLVIFLMNGWLGMLALLGAVGLFACGILNDRLTKNHINESKMNEIQAHQQYQIMASNPETIQGMGMLPSLTKHWLEKHIKSLGHQNTASKRAGEVVSLSKMFRLMLQIFMLAGGAYLIILKQFTPGMMIAGAILLGRALAPIEQSISAWRQVIQAREAYDQLKEYLLLPQPRTEVSGLPTPVGKLITKELTLKMPNAEKPILMNINFQAMPGEMIVIGGPSAAGKSTLARLLIGAIPATHGIVRLDGANIFQWDRTEIGPHIGYMCQYPELFVGTARENIARMQNNVDESVMSTATLSGIHELILKLPQGYDTLILQGGHNLSGGQRQQIALARALFGSPQLVVLDEPTTYLDAQAKVTLNETLHRLRSEGKTLIVITHQLDIMKQADRLLLLREGTIFMYGPTDQVLAKLQEQQTN